MTENLAQFVARTLAQEGIERFFLLTGGDQALWIALDEQGIDPVLCRSEASAVYMADGFAQASGQVAVTYGQAGPGAANVAAALADPYWSRTPLVAITGGTIASARYRNEYQELDTGPMLGAVTAANFELTSPQRIVDLLPRAMAVARQLGPVNVTIPKDIFAAEVRSAPTPVPIPQPAGVAHPDPAAAAAAAEVISGMSRPLVLAGTGAKRAGVGALLREFARSLHAPIATSPGGKGVIRESDELAVGVVGRYAGKVANQVAAEADGLIVVGTRLGGLVTDGYRFGAGATPVVHIDHDASSLAPHPGPGVRLHSDLTPGLAALLAACQPNPEAKGWQERVATLRAGWRAAVGSLDAYGEDGSIRPHALFPRLNALAADLTVVADTGYMAAWTAALFEPGHDRGYFRANGSLGWALPAALGVQAADPSHRVVCVSGDGGIGYHIGDMETAVRRGLPLIVLVLNNRSLAFEYHEQKYRWDGRVVPIVNDLSDLDHAAVARSFGWGGQRVRTLEDFERALDAALGEPERPWLIDVLVDKEAYAPITNYDGVLERAI